ncbi:hypothetical protein [Tychonema sp. BBK16]|uniref:hypothetical protein n=1 Tax=Tychonema sp. BBK16 TaxID=2699888 RepID=UPI001F2E8D49|nr:hypothetical protein [Tychonema sp. BBK16]MCF6371690.1 hypothetical protein [Tychonema sp. BBK16]
MKEEGRRKKEEGRRKKEEGRKPFDFAQGKDDIKSSLHRPVLISLFSSFASFAPSRLNHSDATGNDMTLPEPFDPSTSLRVRL